MGWKVIERKFKTRKKWLAIKQNIFFMVNISDNKIKVINNRSILNNKKAYRTIWRRNSAFLKGFYT
jgi:hypothetical protein